jgi:ankyrin repeat protein
MTCAAYYGHTDVIRELIENGADVNLVRMDGTSPLWLAANAPDDGGESAALELLSNGAKADIVGSRGGTALHGAAFHGREKLAASLLAAGCPVNAVNSKTSYTALHTAAETKHPKVGVSWFSVQHRILARASKVSGTDSSWCWDRTGYACILAA